MYIPNLNFKNLSIIKRQWLIVFIGFYQNNHSGLIFTEILFFTFFSSFVVVYCFLYRPTSQKKLSFTCIFGSVASDLSGAAKFLYTLSTLNTDFFFWQPLQFKSWVISFNVQGLGFKNSGLKSRMLICLRFQDFTCCKH